MISRDQCSYTSPSNFCRRSAEELDILCESSGRRIGLHFSLVDLRFEGNAAVTGGVCSVTLFGATMEGGISLMNLLLRTSTCPLLCFDVVVSMWTHSTDGAINLPQLRSWMFDCYMAANLEFFHHTFMYVVDSLCLFLGLLTHLIRFF